LRKELRDDRHAACTWDDCSQGATYSPGGVIIRTRSYSQSHIGRSRLCRDRWRLAAHLRQPRFHLVGRQRRRLRRGRVPRLLGHGHQRHHAVRLDDQRRLRRPCRPLGRALLPARPNRRPGRQPGGMDHPVHPPVRRGAAAHHRPDPAQRVGHHQRLAAHLSQPIRPHAGLGRLPWASPKGPAAEHDPHPGQPGGHAPGQQRRGLRLHPHPATGGGATLGDRPRLQPGRQPGWDGALDFRRPGRQRPGGS